MTELATKAVRKPVVEVPTASGSLAARIGRFTANFWLEFMFFWTEHWPPFVLLMRGFFLWFAWRYATAFRQNTVDNARGILGREADDAKVESLALAIIRNFYLSIYELGVSVRLSRLQLQQRIDNVEGREKYNEARKCGKGAIILTAHLGSFELGIASLVDLEKRIHVVFQRDAFPRFERLRTRLRRQLGVFGAPVDEGWSIWVRLRDALVADEVVIIQGDRVMPGQKGVPVPFLGGRILMPTGPIKLALATGAPIVPVFSIRTTTGRVRVVVEDPITVAREDGPLDGQHPAMRSLASTIGRHVRAHPEQWLMVEPVWYRDDDESDESS